METSPKIDLISSLSDASLPCSDRVKLIRFIWNTDAVVVPNKEQFSLDFLCEMLSLSDKVDDPKELMSIWRCFRDILETKKCSNLERCGKLGIIKPSVIQVLLNQMLRSAKIYEQNREFVGIVVLSVHRLISLSALGFAITSNFQIMLQLLTATITLFNSDPRLDLKEDCGKLMLLSFQHLSSCQRQMDPTQVIIEICASGLFVEFLQFKLKCEKTNSDGENYLNCLHKLEDIISSALFNKDFTSNYSQYLKSDKRSTKAPKFIGVFLGLIETGVKTSTPGTFYSIGWIFSQFCESYKSERDLCLNMLQLFCKMLGLSSSDETTRSVNKGAISTEHMEALESMLQQVMDRQLYDPATDSLNDCRMKKWFSNVFNHLTREIEDRSSNWFNCIHSLMELVSVEETIHLMAKVWTLNPEDLSTEARICLESMLSGIVENHGRSHEVEQLIQVLFSCIKAGDEVFWPKKFTRSLQTCFSSLPFETVVKLWPIFNTELGNLSSDDANKLKSIARLATIFVRNIVIDSVPERSGTILASCLHTTSSETTKIIKFCLKKKVLTDILADYLDLLHACGELVIVLPSDASVSCKLNESREGIIERMVGSEFTDLSAIYPGLLPKHCNKLHPVCFKHRCTFLISWENLLFQKIKFFALKWHDGFEQQLRRICDFIILEAFPEDTYLSFADAHWSLVFKNLYLLYECLSNIGSDQTTVYDKVLAEYILSTLLKEDLMSDDEDEDESTNMVLVIRQFIRDWQRSGFCGMSSLHTSLCSAILRKMACQFELHTKRQKKSKSSDDDDGGISQKDLLELIEDVNFDSKRDDVSSNNVFQHLNDRFKTTPSLRKASTWGNDNEVVNLLKIVRRILPFFHSRDKVRSVLAAFVLVSGREVGSSILNDCFQLMQEVLNDGPSVVFIIQNLHSGDIVNWLNSLHGSLLRKVKPELAGQCREICRLLLLQSLKHPTGIQNLTDYFEKVVADLKSCRKSSDKNKDELLKVSFDHLAACVDDVNKVLQRHYIRPDILQALTTINNLLMNEFNKSLSKFCKTHESCLSIDESNKIQLDANSVQFAANLLSGFVWHLRGLDKKAAPQDDTADQSCKMIAEHLPVLCRSCLACLASTSDAEVIDRCLNFVSEVCLHPELLASSQPNFLVDVWTMLHLCLQKTIKSRLGIRTSRSLCLTNARNSFVHGHNPEQRLAQTASLVIVSSDRDTFCKRLQSLLTDLETTDSMSKEEMARVLTTLEIWQEMMNCTIAEEMQDVFYYSCQHALVSVQLLLPRCTAPVLVCLLKTLTKFVSVGQNFFGSQEISICLHAFSSMNMDLVTDLDEFVSVFDEVYEFLNALLYNNATTVYAMVPAYVAAVRKFLQAVLWRGRQQVSISYTTEQLNSLQHCALLFTRLANLIWEHKTDFAKVAPYLVSEYATGVSKITPYPIVKKALVPAIYKFLDISSSHALAQLNTALTSGAKEIFKSTYSEFQKYHKYKGRA